MSTSHLFFSCFVKLKWFNPETNVDSLIITEISQASAQQRTGRAGKRSETNNLCFLSFTRVGSYI